MLESLSQQAVEKLPQHAGQIAQAVHDWYRYLIVDPRHLSEPPYEMTAYFLCKAALSPQNVCTSQGQFFDAQPAQREKMLEKFAKTPMHTLTKKYYDWFRKNLPNDENPEKSELIEQTARIYVNQFLSALLKASETDPTLWNTINKNIRLHPKVTDNPVRLSMPFSVRFAIYQQFVVDTYAPQ